MPKDPTQTSRAPWSYVAAFMAVLLISFGAQSSSWAKPAGEIAGSPTTASDLPRARLEQISNAPSNSSSNAPSTMDSTYAAREAKSKNLETFKGGDIVIIGSTTVIIVLLVVLVLIIV